MRYLVVKEGHRRCNTLPPKEVYDVLHEAEAAGIQLPKKVERWWKEETEINEKRRDEEKRAKEAKICLL